MKSQLFLGVLAVCVCAIPQNVHADYALSDTAYAPSDGGLYASSRSNLTQEDVVAKRRAAFSVAKNDKETCQARRLEAIAKRNQMQAGGIDETSTEWKQINRKITILNGRCPGFRKTANASASICKSQEAALSRKLQSMIAAGLPSTNEERQATAADLAAARDACAKTTNR